MAQEKICYVETTSWIGLSPGAIHIYAKLRCGDKSTTMIKKLSARSAAKVNKSRDGMIYRPFKAGDTADFFDGYRDVQRHALKQWKKEFPNAEILIMGESCVCDPQEIIYHPDDDIKQHANQLFEEFESIEGYQYKRNWSKAEQIQDEWDALVKGRPRE